MNSFTCPRSFLALFSFAVALLLGGCSGGCRSVTNMDLLRLMGHQRPPIIVDVRSKGEFAKGHILGAIHIPFYSVGKRHREISMDKDTPMVVYCAHGPRAWWAAFVLRRKGFGQVTTLEGNFGSWQKSGFTFEKNKK